MEFSNILRSQHIKSIQHRPILVNTTLNVPENFNYAYLYNRGIEYNNRNAIAKNNYFSAVWTVLSANKNKTIKDSKD